MNKKIFENYYNSLSRLISAPSVQGEATANAPFGVGVRQALDVTLDIAESLGYHTIDHDGYCGVAEVGEGEPFAILGHVDVVPISSGEWNTPPFTLTTVDDVMYARGVSDDKGPLLLCMYAVRQLLDEGYIPKRKIRFVIGCNEESGWDCIEHFNKVDVMPREGFTPDGSFPVVYCEKGIAHVTISLDKPVGISAITGGQRANMVADYCEVTLDKSISISYEGIEVSSDGRTLVARGKASHGAHPEGGDNAIIKMMKVLSTLYPDYYTRIYDALSDIYASGLGLNGSDESGRCTLCVGKVSMSDRLYITIDIRYPAITYTIGKCLQAIKATFGEDSILTYTDQPPLYVPKDSPLVRTLISAYNEVTGEDLSPIAIGGGTYARALECGVAFGAEFGDYDTHMHEPNENVPIPLLKKTYDIYYEAIKRLCFVNK